MRGARVEETESGKHLGHATLGLLVEDWSVPIMRELLGGSRRPSELEQRIPEAPHSALMRRLGEMEAMGIVTKERFSGLPPRAQYALTGEGRTAIRIVGAARSWERAWSPGTEDGIEALKLIADQRNREILLALAAGRMAPTALEQRLSGSRSTVTQRLAELARKGILARNVEDGHVWYELTDCARELALVGVAAARWEWQWARPTEPVSPSLVADVLHLFAPLVDLPAELAGICRLHVDSGTDGSEVYLAADGYRLAALASPGKRPRGACNGTPQGWVDGLLLRRWRGVTPTGDRALVAAMLASMSAALIQ